MEEVWKDIYYVDCRNNEVIDYRGLYAISNFGRIKNVMTNQIRKTSIENDGRYERISLTNNGIKKRFRIHRLVAEMFLDNADKLTEINHKDENTLNNRVTNLEWCTSSYNVNYGTRNKRVSDRLSKKVMGISENENKVIILKSTRSGKKFGFNNSHISSCCNGKRKKHNKYYWKYI